MVLVLLLTLLAANKEKNSQKEKDGGEAALRTSRIRAHGREVPHGRRTETDLRDVADRCVSTLLGPDGGDAGGGGRGVGLAGACSLAATVPVLSP